jgi:hypothetical protein
VTNIDRIRDNGYWMCKMDAEEHGVTQWKVDPQIGFTQRAVEEGDQPSVLQYRVMRELRAQRVGQSVERVEGAHLGHEFQHALCCEPS